MLQSKFRSLLLMATVVLMFGQAQAGSPAFTGLTQDDIDNFTKEYSSNMAHPSVMGAQSLGSIFGFELGVIGGMSTSPKTKDIIARAGGSGFGDLYHAGLAGAVTVPFGITAEGILMPKLHASGADFQMYSLAVKWTSNEVIPIIPFNLAIRGFYSGSEFSFDQNSNGVTGTVKSKDKVMGLQLLASPRLPVLEPYAGVGFVKADNTLDVSGTGTIFDSSVTSGQSATSKPSTTQFLLGINAKLLLLSLGAEYAHTFNSDRYTAKVGLAF